MSKDFGLFFNSSSSWVQNLSHRASNSKHIPSISQQPNGSAAISLKMKKFTKHKRKEKMHKMNHLVTLNVK
jgi:hypothetical protein